MEKRAGSVCARRPGEGEAQTTGYRDNTNIRQRGKPNKYKIRAIEKVKGET